MSDMGDVDKRIVIERRIGIDRRTGKLDDKFQRSVAIGFFLDMRRGDRRKLTPQGTYFYN